MGFGSRLLAFLIAEDEAGNALIGPDARYPAAGNPHYTISQRVAEMRERGSKLGCWSCKALTWIQNTLFRKAGDHCTQAMDGMPEDVSTGG